jgi:drug/metabolite transporter (DMT)-like permease
MRIGIISALIAGAMWGITFVAPRAVEPFTAFDLAIARNAIFGGASILLMVHPLFKPTGFLKKDVLLSMLLGFIGYVGIFLSVSFAVINAGASIPPLIVGLLPVVLSVSANLKDKSVPWVSLLVPLLLIGGGVMFINVWAYQNSTSLGGSNNIILGVMFSIIALLLWVLYAFLNAKAMTRANPPSTLPWTSLHGVGALLGTIPILLFAMESNGGTVFSQPLDSQQGQEFIFWVIISGIGGSWVAAWSWAVASKRLPLSLAAQLLVSEIIFGLLYGFIYEGRLPSIEEWIGSTMMISGVLAAITVFSRKKTALN